MKIALVNPRIETYSSYMPPLGLFYLGAVLEKENFDVRIFDPYPDDDVDIEDIIDFQPDVIGVTILTCYVPRAKHIISLIKGRLKSVKVIVGGVHVTALPEESLEFFEADFAVFGEGEFTVSELCTRLRDKEPSEDIKGLTYRRNGQIVRTEPRPQIQDLNELPLPARHLVNFDNYLFPPGVIRGFWTERCTSVMTSRGCPFQCIWCGTQTIFGHKVRRRSVDNVILEIESLQENYNIDSIWFVDDTFTLNKKWILEFCNKLIDKKIKLVWGCQSHVTTIDEEMLVIMKRSGLVQLDFGVESGSNKVLKALKKNSSEDSIKKAFDMTKRLGIRRMATVLFGNPQEEKEDIEKTFKITKEIKPDYVSSYFITPFPGTELMNMAKENKWLTGTDYDTLGLKKEPMMKINFSRDELYDFREKFQALFAWTNFFNLFFDLSYMPKLVGVMLRYPRGILKGVRTFLKTKVIDDFAFDFLIYYAGEKQKENRYLSPKIIKLDTGKLTTNKKFILVVVPTMENAYHNFKEFPAIAMPVGLLAVAAVLEREGYEVSIINADAERLTLDETVLRVAEEKPDYVGSTCMTATVDVAYKFYSELKKQLPEVKVIVGGPHVSSLPKATLEESRDIDIVVKGEGDDTTAELMEAIRNNRCLSTVKGIVFRKNGEIFETQDRGLIEDLGRLPLPSYHLLKHDLYRSYMWNHWVSGHRKPIGAIFTARGCFGKCSFCAAKVIFGHGIRYFPLERVKKEIDLLVNKYKVKILYFQDDTFTANRKRVNEICDYLIEKGYNKKLEIDVSSRADISHYPTLLKMRKAGIRWIFFGVESGNQKILDGMCKNISIKQVREAFKRANKAGLYVGGNFIIGSVGETYETVMDTINLARELKQDYASFTVAIPFPGTKLYQHCVDRGTRFPSWNDFGSVNSPPIPLNDALDAEELMKLRGIATNKFFKRPKYLLRMLLRFRTISIIEDFVKMYIALIREIKEKRY